MKRKNKSWLKLKNYAHFSTKLTVDDIPFILSYVKDPKNIEKHKFYPLIHKCIYARKLKLKHDYKIDKKVKCHSFMNAKGYKESTGKSRKLFYATHLDSQIYSYYSNEILGKRYEEILDNRALA